MLTTTHLAYAIRTSDGKIDDRPTYAFRIDQAEKLVTSTFLIGEGVLVNIEGRPMLPDPDHVDDRMTVPMDRYIVVPFRLTVS